MRADYFPSDDALPATMTNIVPAAAVEAVAVDATGTGDSSVEGKKNTLESTSSSADNLATPTDEASGSREGGVKYEVEAKICDNKMEVDVSEEVKQRKIYSVDEALLDPRMYLLTEG